MSFHHGGADPALIRSLQQQIQSLQKSLEEKDEVNFELSATLASVQAEADYRVAEIQRQANWGGGRGASTANTVTPAASTTASSGRKSDSFATETDEGAKFPTTHSTSPFPLAQHLVQQSNSKQASLPPNLLVLLGTPTMDPDRATRQLLWKLVELCLSDRDNLQNWQWLKEAVAFSACARRELRNAMNATTDKAGGTATSSRIQGGNVLWDQFSHSIREPLGLSSVLSSGPLAQSKTDAHHRLYTRQLASQLQKQLLLLDNETKIRILSTILSDISNSDKLAWQRMLCGSTTAPMIQILLPLLVSDGVIKGRRSSVLLAKNTLMKTASNDKHLSLAILAVKLLGECGGWSCSSELHDASEALLGLMLDLLESRYISERTKPSPTDINLIVAILQVIQYTVCHHPSRGVWSLRTQLAVGGNGGFACSGVGVVVQVFYKSTVLREEPTVSNECVRILHFILKQIQQERQRADEASTSFVSFLSVVSEHEHLFRASCHDILRRGQESHIYHLVQLQVEEIAMDDEEEDEMKQEAAQREAGT